MKVSAQHLDAKRLIQQKISLSIFCAIVLCLAPSPSFAQHTGGGGGTHGGGSSGGHSGGGGHSSGGGHHGPAAGTSSGSGGGMHVGGASHSDTQAVATSNAAYGGSHVWVGPSVGSSATSRPVERFAAGNNVWQDPPTARGSSAVNSAASSKAPAVGQSNLTATRARPFVAPTGSRLSRVGVTQTPRPPIIFHPQPRRRFLVNNFSFSGSECFGGFFAGFCGSGLWWGPGYGWGLGCDPVLGCTGSSYSNYGLDAPDYLQVQSDNPSQEYGPFRWQDSTPTDSADAIAPSKPAATIYLKDGSSYGVTDYWLAGGELHYITNYGGENSISLGQLDLQRTVDENAALGVNFILSNQPSTRP
jgi:hypothetical protein